MLQGGIGVCGRALSLASMRGLQFPSPHPLASITALSRSRSRRQANNGIDGQSPYDMGVSGEAILYFQFDRREEMVFLTALLGS